MPTDLWRQCFLASLTGYISSPYTTEGEGIPCDEIAEWSATQADEAVKLIERRWPVKKTRAVFRFATAREKARNRGPVGRKRKK